MRDYMAGIATHTHDGRVYVGRHEDCRGHSDPKSGRVCRDDPHWTAEVIGWWEKRWSAQTSDTGAASAVLLAASAPVIVMIVTFAAHLYGAVAGVAF